MEYPTYLTTMAQIAGVLVGFANLVNAISRPDLPEIELEINKVRIIITTEVGLVLIGLCILPLLMSASKYSDVEIFQGLSFITFWVGVIYYIANLIRVKRTTGKYFPTKLAPFMQIGILIFVLTPLLLNSFKLFGIDNIVFVYCLPTFYLFILVCVLFCRLLYSLLPRTHL